VSSLNSAVYLLLGLVLQFTPTWIWILYSLKNGPLYIGILVFQLILMVSTIITMGLSACRRTKATHSAQLGEAGVLHNPLQDDPTTVC